MNAAASVPRAPDFRSQLAETALVLLVSCVATYLIFVPVFDDFVGQVVVGPGILRADTNLMLWILSWGSHAIWAQPLDFFQANILHPSPSMLAGAEHMTGYLPMFAPAYYLSGNPVFGYQITLFLCFALSGAAMYALLRHWGCSRYGAAFGGLIMIAAPGKFSRAFVVQSVAWCYLPIALIYFDRVLDRGRLRDGIGLAVAMSLQLLTSFYLAYISLAILGAYSLLVLPWGLGVRRQIDARNLLRAGAALAVAGMVLVVFALPYAQRASLGEIPDNATAGLKSYSIVKSWHPYLRSPRTGPVFGASYYIGAIPFLLALYALVPSRSSSRVRGSVRVYALWAAALATGILAAGPGAVFAGFDLPPLYDLFLLLPGFSSVRGATRFGLGVDFAMAALAGIGLSDVLRRVEAFRVISVSICIAVIAFTYFDFGLAGIRHNTMSVPAGESVPGVYRKLAELEHGVLLEVPAGPDRGLRQMITESQYGYFSTFHWHRILNGYTGYLPASTTDVMTVANALPDRRALDTLVRMTGLRYVVVHLANMPPHSAEVWRSPSGLELVERFDDDLLFQVAEPLAVDLQKVLLDSRQNGQTFGGLPVALLPPAARAASVRFTAPAQPRSAAGLIGRLEAAVRNESSSTWPGLAPGGGEVVHWAIRWVHQRTGKVTEQTSLAPLAYDLRPGEELRATLSPRCPRDPGPYRVEVGLSQGGQWFPSASAPEPVELVSIKAGRRARAKKH